MANQEFVFAGIVACADGQSSIFIGHKKKMVYKMAMQKLIYFRRKLIFHKNVHMMALYRTTVIIFLVSMQLL